ncbi:DUF746 domain-containing protein [Burkholderia ubonensis]|uniref:DUF746 domain-containing protein n=1 Tax=Burkholderia ubonensis TaxID=101571 RepID=UPI0012FA342D
MAALPWLSRRCLITRAAQKVGTTPESLSGWTLRFCRWLLVLDPSGEMECKVRLGLPRGNSQSGMDLVSAPRPGRNLNPEGR